jgi:hypothetical protein
MHAPAVPDGIELTDVDTVVVVGDNNADAEVGATTVAATIISASAMTRDRSWTNKAARKANAEIPASMVPRSLVRAKEYYLPALPMIKALLCSRSKLTDATAPILKQLSALFFQNKVPSTINF